MSQVETEAERPISRAIRFAGALRATLRFALDVGLPPLCPSCRELLGHGGALCASCWSRL
jgi:hypothetical protein